MRSLIRALLIISTFSGSVKLSGQEIHSFEDIKSVFTFYPNKKAAEADTTLYKSKLVVAPIISYSPETNFGFGVGSKYLFKFKGSGEETRTSNMPMTLQYTLNNQFILYSGFEIFTNQEKWVISGNIRFQNYPRLYYGLGRDASEESESEYNYYQALFEPIFMKQLFLRHLFIGAGIRYNRIFNVEVEDEELTAKDKPSGYNGSTSLGTELAVLYDSRDNILNAKTGWYLEFTYGLYDEIWVGTNKFELARYDLRHYITPFKKRNDVLAFQLIGHFSYNDVPFSEMALFGSSEILRGYREGRFIDRNLIAGQTEYRLNIENSRLNYRT